MWAEQKLRDAILRNERVSASDAQILLDEIDKLRAAIEKMKAKAFGNHIVRRIAEETLK